VAAIVRTTLAMVTLSAGFIGQLRGPLTWTGRLALIALGILWIVPHWAWDLLACIGSLFVFLDRRRLYQTDLSTSTN